MKCPSCNKPMKDEWKFCPDCGYKKKEGFFDSVFSRFRREMEEMNRSSEKEFETFDISDMMRMPGSKGFRIKIVSGSGMQPKVEVQSTGDIDKKELERQLQSMGVRIEMKKPVASKSPSKPKIEPMKMPDITEEPETTVKRAETKVLVEMKLPGVDDKGLRIQEFESSIEVRAIGKEKAFFKIVTKPENASILRKEFKNGTLILEVG